MAENEKPSNDNNCSDDLLENNYPFENVIDTPSTDEFQKEKYLNSDAYNEFKSFVPELMKLTFENIRQIIDKNVLSEGVVAFYGALKDTKPSYERLLDKFNINEAFLENPDTSKTIKVLLPTFIPELKEGISNTIAIMDNFTQTETDIYDRLKIILRRISDYVEGVEEVDDCQLDIVFAKIEKISVLLEMHLFNSSTEYLNVIENILFSDM